MVGLTMAAALGSAGLDVVVVAREGRAIVTNQSFDGRTSAIAHGSKRVLDVLGLWPRLAPSAEPILDIRVSDDASLLCLHFDHRELSEAPLGYIVENRNIRRALHAHLAGLANVCVLAPAAVTELDRSGSHIVATLEDGKQLLAALAIAADGRESPTRRAVGIATTEWTYPQTSIVCAVAHERPHRGVAHERFLPAGPLAMLPMTGRCSSVVWTERDDLAPAIMALDEAAFAGELERRFGSSLGRLQPVGGRWSHKLALLHADRYVDRRLALVGDAAHAIHPIAGQGLNLGLRDIAALAETVVDAVRLGLDPGDMNALVRYERWRRSDNVSLIAITDGLNRLFSTAFPPIRLARDLGLGLVSRTPPLRRLLMRHAMGIVGDLPRLVRGQAL